MTATEFVTIETAHSDCEACEHQADKARIYAKVTGSIGSRHEDGDHFANVRRPAKPGLDSDHAAGVTPGGLSNFTVRCNCGKTWGVATSNRESAQKSADEHVAAFVVDHDADPFAGLGR